MSNDKNTENTKIEPIELFEKGMSQLIKEACSEWFLNQLICSIDGFLEYIYVNQPYVNQSYLNVLDKLKSIVKGSHSSDCPNYIGKLKEDDQAVAKKCLFQLILFNSNKPCYFTENSLVEIAIERMQKFDSKYPDLTEYERKVIHHFNSLIAEKFQIRQDRNKELHTLYELQEHINRLIFKGVTDKPDLSIGGDQNVGLKNSPVVFKAVRTFYYGILSPIRIIAIKTNFQQLMSNVNLFPKYNEVFLLGNKARRMLLTDGGVFGKPAQSSLHTIGSSEDGEKFWLNLEQIHQNKKGKDGMEGFSVMQWLLFFFLGTVRQHVKSEKASTIPNSKEIIGIIDPQIYFWPGVGMNFPNKTKFTLCFDKLYPVLYVRTPQKIKDFENGYINSVAGKIIKVDDKKFDQQIYLEEEPWCVNILFYEDTIKKISNDGGKNLLKEFSFPTKGDIASKMSISKLLGLGDKKNKEPANPNFQDLSMIINDELEHCEVIVEIPYIPPSFDSLLTIKFQGREKEKPGKEEIILTTG